MATFNINLPRSFVNGTAASDTFNINAPLVTAFGLEGDDQFSVSGGPFFVLSLDGGTGNDSFSFAFVFEFIVFGGSDMFMTSGGRNNFSGGAGNDWIGIGGGASSTHNVLDGGDGDDWVGATGDINTLFGAAGNDHLEVTGSSNTLDGGTGNDSLYVVSGSDNNLIAGAAVHLSSFAMRWTVPVPMPRDLATFKIPMPFASCVRTLRSVVLSTISQP